MWISYPNKSAKLKTDIIRDIGWDTVVNEDYKGDPPVSIDDTWSSFRFIRGGR